MLFLFGMNLSLHSPSVFVCVRGNLFLCERDRDGSRSSATGDHSPETFISHYPERERGRERTENNIFSWNDLQRKRQGLRDRQIKNSEKEEGRDKGEENKVILTCFGQMNECNDVIRVCLFVLDCVCVFTGIVACVEQIDLCYLTHTSVAAALNVSYACVRSSTLLLCMLDVMFDCHVWISWVILYLMLLVTP